MEEITLETALTELYAKEPRGCDMNKKYHIAQILLTKGDDESVKRCLSDSTLWREKILPSLGLTLSHDTLNEMNCRELLHIYEKVYYGTGCSSASSSYSLSERVAQSLLAQEPDYPEPDSLVDACKEIFRYDFLLNLGEDGGVIDPLMEELSQRGISLDREKMDEEVLMTHLIEPIRKIIGDLYEAHPCENDKASISHLYFLYHAIHPQCGLAHKRDISEAYHSVRCQGLCHSMMAGNNAFCSDECLKEFMSLAEII